MLPWSHEIPTLKNWGPTKYSREKIGDPQNTHKKKLETHEDPKNWPNDWAVSWVCICMVHLTVLLLSCHPRVSEWNLNVKELLGGSRCHMWSLSDSNRIRTHNHLVCKWTLNLLAKLAKLLTCVVSTYLYGAYTNQVVVGSNPVAVTETSDMAPASSKDLLDI